MRAGVNRLRNMSMACQIFVIARKIEVFQRIHRCKWLYVICFVSFLLGIPVGCSDQAQNVEVVDFKAVILAAEQGDVKAQNILGEIYAKVHVISLDYVEDVNWYHKYDAEAVMWYRRAAFQGDADAQNNLGWMYANGRGVAKNETEAVNWYRVSAGQGHASAQYNLGLMYDKGRGVAKDEGETVKWFEKAAEQGHKNAKKALADMENRASPVSK